MIDHTTQNYRQGVKRDYHACRVGYETSLGDLIRSGMTASEADDYLFLRDDVRAAGECEGDERIADAVRRAGNPSA